MFVIKIWVNAIFYTHNIYEYKYFEYFRHIKIPEEITFTNQRPKLQSFQTPV